MQFNGYENLAVWKKSMELVTQVYVLTQKFPASEVYGLTSQMRRCAVSIPSNIAEGYRRGSKKDYRHFLTISFGSGAELETQVKIAKNLNYGTVVAYTPVDSLLIEVMKLLYTMRKDLE